jgi:F-type H+-transporting ATPase subunit b
LLALATALLVSPAVRAEGHGGVEIDERLVPIPPSRDTVISAAWVLVLFLVLLGVLYPLAWKNVLNGLKNREKRIRTDVAEADAARARADALLKQFESQIAAAEARSAQMISDATVQGEKLATQIRMQAQQEAEAAKESATREIEAARDAAVQDIRKEVGTLATMVASKVMRRNLGAADHADLVDEAIASMQSA